MNVRGMLGLGALACAVAVGASAPASARPIGFGGGCVLDPGDRAATVDALRFRCTPAQDEAVFRAAQAGPVPRGHKDGWVTASSAANSAVGPVSWTGKDFDTGPDGGSVLNRTSSGDTWPATVYRAPSRLDGRPCWALNYASSPTPTVYDEIRQVTPGVWLGYTLWPGVYDTPFQLTFVLA